MPEQGQALPPAAIECWYDLAAAVVRGIKDPEERAKWQDWAEMREILHPFRQAGSGRKARRMGAFEDGQTAEQEQRAQRNRKRRQEKRQAIQRNANMANTDVRAAAATLDAAIQALDTSALEAATFTKDEHTSYAAGLQFLMVRNVKQMKELASEFVLQLEAIKTLENRP